MPSKLGGANDVLTRTRISNDCRCRLDRLEILVQAEHCWCLTVLLDHLYAAIMQCLVSNTPDLHAHSLALTSHLLGHLQTGIIYWSCGSYQLLKGTSAVRWRSR